MSSAKSVLLILSTRRVQSVISARTENEPTPRLLPPTPADIIVQNYMASEEGAPSEIYNVCMYVKIRRHQHTRVHAHTGPRRHAKAPACHRHHIPRLVRRQACHTQTTISIGSPSLCDRPKGGERGGGAARIFLGLETAARLGL